jgi:hypothetical protein
MVCNGVGTLTAFVAWSHLRYACLLEKLAHGVLDSAVWICFSIFTVLSIGGEIHRLFSCSLPYEDGDTPSWVSCFACLGFSR